MPNPESPEASDPSQRSSPFERYSHTDIVDQIREYPLAWVCPREADPMLSTMLPLLPETNAAGELQTLLGHIPRRNPLYQALIAQPRAFILFCGPQAYVSPACVSDPDWAPTWNFAQVRLDVTISFDEGATDMALRTLTQAMEVREPTGWTPEHMGERYSRLSRAVIAFRAVVIQQRARFKLGQDEKPERLAEILTRHPDADLVRWMRRFNTGRC